MNKIASYLQSHVSGEVVDTTAVREHFATDGSVLSIKPMLVAHPRTTNDIRKIVRFSWQLAEKGHGLPITARGSGTDVTGAAIGSGVIISSPAHLNRILELDSQQKLVRVQPGVNFKSLQETLQTHGLFLPPFPASYEYSTIGGAIANNASGEKSFKYGTMREWVDKLEVVLANGELIQTGRMSKKQVEKKKGLPTLEGEIYRAVDAIDLEYGEAYDAYYDKLGLEQDSVGYCLRNVVRRDGSIDLTPLFVGSQGTLGIVSEAILRVAPHNPRTKLVVAGFSGLDTALPVFDDIRKLQPSAFELVDKSLLSFAKETQGYTLPPELADESFAPAAVVFVEFDDVSTRTQSKKLKRARQLLLQHADRVLVASSLDEQEKLWAIRHSAATVVGHNKAGKAALPIMEDASVPPEKLADLLKAIAALADKYHMPLAVWGHIGDAIVHTYPLFDLSKQTDRQHMLKLMDEYFRTVVSLGGTITAGHNDGRLRSPFAKLQTGERLVEMAEKLKAAFDPQGILNPGVKTGSSLKNMTNLLRHEYSTARLSDYLPRT